MIELLILILLVAWLFGAVVVPIGSSLIHLLLVIILVLVIVRLTRGQRPLL